MLYPHNPDGPVLCPKCQNQAQIVQAIYSAGTVEIEGASYHSGTVHQHNGQSSYSGGGRLYAISQSDLAKVVSPPVAPEQPGAWGCGTFAMILGGLILAGIVGAAFNTPTSSKASQLIGIGLAMVIFIGTIASVIAATANKQKQINVIYAPQYALYQIAYQRWQEMYYCAFDHGIFLKSERNWVPATSKETLLHPPVA